jgi:2,4-dienoyl-CoA reductase (NADPH2)
VLAALGYRVVLYEAQSELGGQFRLASRIPGKGEFARTIGYFEHELRRLGAEIRLQQRIDEASCGELDEYDGVVVATGVVPRRIDLPGIDLPLVCSYPRAVLGAECGPRRSIPEATGPVAVLGAGGIGVDVAHLFSHRGRAVTLMRRGGVLGEHIGRSTRWVLLQALRARGVQMLTGVSYERIVPEGVWIGQPDGERRLIAATHVVIAAGQECNDPLSRALGRRGKTYRIVGGARCANGLDAVQAFREGALAAHLLAQTVTTGRAAESERPGADRPNRESAQVRSASGL